MSSRPRRDCGYFFFDSQGEFPYNHSRKSNVLSININSIDEIENEAWEEYEKLQAMGDAVAAIEQGYLQREVAKSAYEFERKLQTGEELRVGVNCFTGEQELEVETTRPRSSENESPREDRFDRMNRMDRIGTIGEGTWDEACRTARTTAERSGVG